MKEYGGYFPIEIYHGKEFYDGCNVSRFNCARSAIEYIIENENYKKIYLPYYLCESVRIAVKRHQIKIEYYHIDSDFVPQIDSIEADSVILITNYFGIKYNDNAYVEKYGNVIFDNTQAFYEEPIPDAYNVYSCRKFFGVCDGAYLISNLIKTKETLESYVPKYALFLLDSISNSTNYGYEDSLRNEEQISSEGIKGISKLSRCILKGIDYEKIREKRIKNFGIVEETLGGSNELRIPQKSDTVPMCYPLLVHNEKLREILVKEKVYVPQWWKYLLYDNEINGFERGLAQFLIPLPIDQRYNEEDMCRIVETIKCFLK